MSPVLIVFARLPRLGRVKTRLESHLSRSQCLQLYLALMLDTLDRVGRIPAQRYLYLADCSRRELQEFARDHPPAGRFQHRIQRGKDLGQRMWNAFREVGGGRPVIFLGADSPTLPLDYVRQGVEELAEVPVVVGPVEDGGYYLLGLADDRPRLFEGVEWGSSRVLEQTLSRLEPSEYRLLPTWYDVDTPGDLERLEQDLGREFEGFPCRTRESIRLII